MWLRHVQFGEQCRDATAQTRLVCDDVLEFDDFASVCEAHDSPATCGAPSRFFRSGFQALPAHR
jgi:hypothetical protein